MRIPLPVLLVIDMFLENEDILQETSRHSEYNIECEHTNVYFKKEEKRKIIWRLGS